MPPVIQPNALDLSGDPPSGGAFSSPGILLPDWCAIIYPPGNGVSGWKGGIKYGSILFPGRGDTDDPMTADGTLSSPIALPTDAGLQPVAADDFAWVKGTITADSTSGALSVSALAVEWTGQSGATWGGGEFEHDGGQSDGTGGTIYTQKYFRMRLGKVLASPLGGGALYWQPWVLGPLCVQGMWVECVNSSAGDSQTIIALAPVPFGGG